MNRLLQRLEDQRPLIMGILNRTPDSFSDGGAYATLDRAVERGLAMAGEGADIIDIGGESTRPGSKPVSVDEQLERVLPVIERLHAELPVTCSISIDTTRMAVARAAIQAGAHLVNDVSAGLDDEALFPMLAESGIPVVLMHRQGRPETMQDDPRYDDVVTEVESFLKQRVEAARVAGIPREYLILDPGIGFGKLKSHNLALLASLSRFADLQLPLLLGVSRKRFMGAICREENPSELLGATVATTALGVQAGVRLFRVHDVKPNRQAADVAAAILAEGPIK